MSYIDYSSAPPVPFTERWSEGCGWHREGWDRNLPQKGFITDFVYATRGIETPSNFCAWSAIYLLSALVKRDVWLQWYPGKLFLNLYLLFVAPPRICPKTTAIKLAENYVLKPCLEHIKDPVVRAKKELNILPSRATMERLYTVLMPHNKSIWVDDELTGRKKTEEVKVGSQLAIMISEFSTFLGKQQYNVGLVDKLVDWYDCFDGDKSETVTRGGEQLEDIYVTLLGGTTFDGLKLTIPTEALKGGFISRLVIITNKKRKRMFPRPIAIPGAPSFEELSTRLAWIIENAKGEYTFSEEADRAYDKWYKDFCYKLDNDEYGDVDRSRTDTNVLKVATLMRIQRYERGNEISLQDFEDAVKIVEANINPEENPLEEVGKGTYEKIYSSVLKKLNKLKEGERLSYGAVLKSTSPEKKGGNAMHVKMALEQLHGEGRIRVFREGEERERLLGKYSEEYEWKGEV